MNDNMLDMHDMMEDIELPQLQLARAYIPIQKYTKSYSDEEALEKGTMFPELYSPYNKLEGLRGDMHA